MQTIKHLLIFSLKFSCLLAFNLLCFECSSQSNDEIILVKGTIGNQFHLSSTHLSSKNERIEFIMEVEPILDKVDLLDKYYSFENQVIAVT